MRAVGTRFSDFTSGSWALFKNPNRRFIGLNTQPFDAAKHRALPLVADARAGLGALDAGLGDWRAPVAWAEFVTKAKREWLEIADGAALDYRRFSVVIGQRHI